jgi:hypothetical protein
MNNEEYHTVRIVQKSNQKNDRKREKSTPLTYIHMTGHCRGYALQ